MQHLSFRKGGEMTLAAHLCSEGTIPDVFLSTTQSTKQAPLAFIDVAHNAESLSQGALCFSEGNPFAAEKKTVWRVCCRGSWMLT